jgi:ribosomal protein S18 acetylase RimI-like enzyme
MIRRAMEADLAPVLALYRAVAAQPDGLARAPHEVTHEYVGAFMRKAAQDGVEFVCVQDGRIVGEIHASRVGIGALAHLLTDLTLAVAPDCQRQGVGRRLFEALLDEVSARMPHIGRVELFARASNLRAHALYRALGFVEEGRLRGRVLNARGQLEDDLIMGWQRPS